MNDRYFSMLFTVKTTHNIDNQSNKMFNLKLKRLNKKNNTAD